LASKNLNISDLKNDPEWKNLGRSKKSREAEALGGLEI